MEFKEGSILITKEGEFPLKKMVTLYNPFSLTPSTVFIVDDNGEEKRILDKDVISIKNNHLENIEEP
jgi:hypothetical protein